MGFIDKYGSPGYGVDAFKIDFAENVIDIVDYIVGCFKTETMYDSSPIQRIYISVTMTSSLFIRFLRYN